MDREVHDAVVKSIRELEHSMRVSVKIPHDEANRLVITILIGIRNSDVNANSDMTHFDKVIRHFLDEDEFQKYVIEGVEIEN